MQEGACARYTRDDFRDSAVAEPSRAERNRPIDLDLETKIQASERFPSVERYGNRIRVRGIRVSFPLDRQSNVAAIEFLHRYYDEWNNNGITQRQSQYIGLRAAMRIFNNVSSITNDRPACTTRRLRLFLEFSREGPCNFCKILLCTETISDYFQTTFF